MITIAMRSWKRASDRNTSEKDMPLINSSESDEKSHVVYILKPVCGVKMARAAISTLDGQAEIENTERATRIQDSITRRVSRLPTRVSFKDDLKVRHRKPYTSIHQCARIYRVFKSSCQK